VKKSSILVLTSSFPRWSNDTDPPFVYQLARKLSDYFDITVLAPHCNGARKYEKLDNLDVVRFKYFFTKYQKLAYQGGILSNLKHNSVLYLQIPFFILFELASLLHLIARLKPNVIHAHWVIPQTLIAVIACRMVRCAPKIICTAHGADVYGLKGRLFKKIKQFVFKNIDVCTVVSNALRKEVLRLAEGTLPIHVMPMGVNLTDVFTQSQNPPRRNQLLFVGRLVEKKGVRYLLEAMPKIIENIPDATLQVIGDGHNKSDHIRYVNENNLGSSVIFHGAVNNTELPQFYQASEILVFPSIVAKDGDQEGLGLVPVEAMGCGCGIIATDLDAIKDVVQDKINGLIIPQRSSEAITAAVLQLLQNRSLLRQYRRAGRQYAIHRFDWKVVAEGYKKVIQHMIDV
jgi:glycosyltransferase involved in cell wall biosynthesis